MVEGEHALEDGVVLMPLPGHTPGHMGLHIRARGAEAVLTGDMIHHPLQIRYPDWTSNACADKALSHKTRTGFIERYADSGVTIVPSHFPAPTFGTIESAGGSFRWQYDE
jgi:glyoxylase-like metal-dependent hydrolase (beta-lactamase superfamily II)